MGIDFRWKNSVWGLYELYLNTVLVYSDLFLNYTKRISLSVVHAPLKCVCLHACILQRVGMEFGYHMYPCLVKLKLYLNFRRGLRKFIDIDLQTLFEQNGKNLRGSLNYEMFIQLCPKWNSDQVYRFFFCSIFFQQEQHVWQYFRFILFQLPNRFNFQGLFSYDDTKHNTFINSYNIIFKNMHLKMFFMGFFFLKILLFQ